MLYVEYDCVLDIKSEVKVKFSFFSASMNGRSKKIVKVQGEVEEFARFKFLKQMLQKIKL